MMPGPTSEQVQSLVLNTLDSIPSGSKLDSRDLTLKFEDGSEVAFNEGDNQVLLKGVLDSLFSREVSKIGNTVSRHMSAYGKVASQYGTDGRDPHHQHYDKRIDP